VVQFLLIFIRQATKGVRMTINKLPGFETLGRSGTKNLGAIANLPNVKPPFVIAAEDVIRQLYPAKPKNDAQKKVLGTLRKLIEKKVFYSTPDAKMDQVKQTLLKQLKGKNPSEALIFLQDKINKEQGQVWRNLIGGAASGTVESPIAFAAKIIITRNSFYGDDKVDILEKNRKFDAGLEAEKVKLMNFFGIQDGELFTQGKRAMELGLLLASSGDFAKGAFTLGRAGGKVVLKSSSSLRVTSRGSQSDRLKITLDKLQKNPQLLEHASPALRKEIQNWDNISLPHQGNITNEKYFQVTTLAEVGMEYRQRYNLPFNRNLTAHDGYSHLLDPKKERTLAVLDSPITAIVDDLIRQSYFGRVTDYNREELIDSVISGIQNSQLDSSKLTREDVRELTNYVLDRIESDARLNNMTPLSFLNNLTNVDTAGSLKVRRPNVVPVKSRSK
jgi:hypothetical protein